MLNFWQSQENPDDDIHVLLVNLSFVKFAAEVWIIQHKYILHQKSPYFNFQKAVKNKPKKIKTLLNLYASWVSDYMEPTRVTS